MQVLKTNIMKKIYQFNCRPKYKPDTRTDNLYMKLFLILILMLLNLKNCQILI